MEMGFFMYKCKECEKEFKSLKSLGTHKLKSHGVQPRDTFIECELKGVIPECNCGCGEEPKFLSITRGYREYVRGHAARVNNNWGHNPEVLKKSHDTQKKMYKSGELTIWNKGLNTDDPRVKKYGESISNNVERGVKISEALTDVPKSEEHKMKLSETAKVRWSDPKEREKQSHRRMLWMRENDYTVKSKTEEIINTVLLTLGLKEDIDYERQFYIRDTKSYYDFKIFKGDILIEIDGDFWHCNPNTKFKEPKYECQFKNLKRDNIKNEWCKDNNIKLIRFWEYDINNNLNDVINTLKLLI